MSLGRRGREGKREERKCRFLLFLLLSIFFFFLSIYLSLVVVCFCLLLLRLFFLCKRSHGLATPNALLYRSRQMCKLLFLSFFFFPHQTNKIVEVCLVKIYVIWFRLLYVRWVHWTYIFSLAHYFGNFIWKLLFTHMQRLKHAYKWLKYPYDS